MQIKRALNGRDRHFVEICTDGRQRCRVVRVFTRRYAAEIHLRKTWSALLNGDRRQKLYNILQFADLKLVELFITNRVDGDRHILQILFTLLRSHDDDIAVLFSCLLRHSWRCEGG